MNIFRKSDLNYQNRYSWNIENPVNSFRAASSANTVFNRHDGYEVLGLINKFIQTHNLINLKSAEKIETMLINLPFECKTHRQVGEWILKHWNKKVPYPGNSFLVMAC